MRVAALGALFSVLLVATAADAAPTTSECLHADEEFLALRAKKELVAARERVIVCASASCPADVQQECAAQLARLDAALPTLVVTVKDESGNDIAHARVEMDAKPFGDDLSAAVAVDPGEHHLTVSPDGFPPLDRTIVLHEGEKNRVEHFVFKTKTSGSALRVGGIAIAGAGVVGLVVGGILGAMALGAWSSSQDACSTSTNCRDYVTAKSDHDTADALGNASTALFIAGGALVVVGGFMFFVAPSGGPKHAAFNLGLRF